VYVLVDMAISILSTALIREINWPHRGAIHMQFEDIGASVMPARIELPTGLLNSGNVQLCNEKPLFLMHGAGHKATEWFVNHCIARVYPFVFIRE